MAAALAITEANETGIALSKSSFSLPLPIALLE